MNSRTATLSEALAVLAARLDVYLSPAERTELKAAIAACSVLNFGQLAAVNATRALRWHRPENGGIREWNIAEWTNAMAGEAGEACNAAKKMRRIECGMQQHGGDSGVPAGINDAKVKILKEVGDTVIYADLVCQRIDMTMEEAVRYAFNQVSVREGFPERL